MFNGIFFLAIFHLVCSDDSTNHSGKKYYFRIGKNNEYRVHNRIFYLNHNITDSINPHAKSSNSNTRVFKTEESHVQNDSGLQVLDEEWNYNHTNLHRTVLPLFIRKFYEQSLNSSRPKSTIRILFNENRNNSNNIMYFNLNSIRIEESILDAELYFYWPLKNTSSLFKESIVLRLYQFEKQNSDVWNQSRPTGNPDVHKLFNVIYVSKAQKGWQTFKVKKPIDNWMEGEENLGLLLTISYYDNNTLIEIYNDTNSGNLSTFIVANVQINGTQTSQFDTMPQHQQTKSSSANQCRKQEWTIDFLSLGWNEFIIAPQFFNAFDCTGRCVKVSESDSNHAKLVQNMQKRVTCCVPVEYQDLVIMYYDRYGNVAIKRYDDIVTAECGCR